MMSLIPTRIELLHPMLTHFPVALLLSGALARVLLLFFENRAAGTTIRWIYLWSWTLGCLGLVATYLTGEEAEDVVNRIICDPTITHEHADFAFYCLCLAFGTLLISFIRILLATKLREKIERAVRHAPSKFAALTKGVLFGELLCAAATVGILVWTAHLGGTLVYEQGAGYLREPNVNCQESQDSNEPVNPDPERSGE